MQISKALKTRCKAIQTALKHYNLAAAALDPPCPHLEWQNVVEYGSIAEFDLLCCAAREDIRQHQWANAVNHQATIYALKLENAHAEIY